MKEMDFINQWQALLPMDGSVSQLESERRASIFLSAMAHITTWRLLYAEELIRATSISTATYGSLVTNSESRNITEAKILVQGSPEYQKVNEEAQHLEVRVRALGEFYNVFINAHIFYRHLAKGEIA